ncbi:uncharacterized protein L201_005439 [Kwoniella dendrophila CBS 6074]|uniref:Beta-1,4-mannosyl-glycoprotein beta-1,4-N-acetylglucosaminyltransferase n=1 Tax=Kwoniella dendrophila CBS 6074 TaxID=1295534 RepID=A0AAX4K066_9TREE
MTIQRDIELGEYKVVGKSTQENGFQQLIKLPISWIDSCFRRRTGLKVKWLIGLGVFTAMIYLTFDTLTIWKRDLGYIFRPIWDKPEKPWINIKQVAPPGDIDNLEIQKKWCNLHEWDIRQYNNDVKPKIIDAILFSSELDLLEIRLKEYSNLVDIFVIVESNMTFSGKPKPTYFNENEERFYNIIPKIKIIHHIVGNFEKDLPVGSFDNEIKQRVRLGSELKNLARNGDITHGDLVLMSDVDEIVSSQTLNLLKTCKFETEIIHLNVKNYRYSFEFPLADDGYFRPKVTTYTGKDESLNYNHGRKSDYLLGGSGWHCSFCFETLSQIKTKMLGYSHNDRARNPALVETDRLRETVCQGKDPFDMYPEAFTFKDIIAQSGKPKKSNSFTDIPKALKNNPDRLCYLLDGGCERPE